MFRSGDMMERFSFPLGAASNARYAWPGSTAAQINAHIAALAMSATASSPGVVFLAAGRYSLEAKITMASFVSLVGLGTGARLVAAFSPSAGLADDPTNCLVDASGATDTVTLNTTLSATANRGATSLTIAAAPGNGTLNGKWIELNGNVSNDQSNGDTNGTSVILDEILKVVSNTGGTLTVKPTDIHHSVFSSGTTGTSVWAVNPLQNVSFYNIDFAAEGGTVAVGVQISRSVRTRFVGCSGAGFSRALIDATIGCAREVVVLDTYCRGECNAVLFMHSGIGWLVDGMECDPNGLRTHANGVPRGLITLRKRTTDCFFGNLKLENGCVGIMNWGGHGNEFLNVLIKHMVPDASYDAMIAAGEYSAGYIGAGISGTSTNASVYGEYALDTQWDNITVEDCTTTKPFTGGIEPVVFAIYRSDDFNEQWGGVQVRVTTPDLVGGFGTNDASGWIDELAINGVSFAWWTHGAICSYNIKDAAFDANPNCKSGQAAGDKALYLNHSTTGLRFGRLQLKGYNAVITIGASLTSGQGMLQIGTWINGNDLQPMSDLELAFANNAMTRFDLVEVDQTNDATAPNGSLFVKTRTKAADTRLAICAYTAAINNWTLVAQCPVRNPNTVTATAAVCKRGDIVAGDGTTAAAVSQQNGLATPLTRVGKVLYGCSAAGGPIMIGEA